MEYYIHNLYLDCTLCLPNIISREVQTKVNMPNAALIAQNVINKTCTKKGYIVPAALSENSCNDKWECMLPC